MGISATQIRKGMILEVDGEHFKVHDYQHVTPGKGPAMMQTRLRNLRTGSIVDRRFRSAESVETVQQDNRAMQYLYQEGDMYTFMDLETYEQIAFPAERLKDAIPYLIESLEVTVAHVAGSPLGVEVPATIELTVTATDPAIKGATAAAQTKPATLQTGLVIQVPPFVTEGDRVRVDTATGSYLTRCN